jgi:hypothetical protein
VRAWPGWCIRVYVGMEGGREGGRVVRRDCVSLSDCLCERGAEKYQATPLPLTTPPPFNQKTNKQTKQQRAGVVFRGLWAGQSVAVKKLKHGTRRQVAEFRNEVRVLAKLRHPVRLVLFWFGFWGC